MNKRIAKKIVKRYFLPRRIYHYEEVWVNRVRKAYILVGKRPPVLAWRKIGTAKDRRRRKLNYTRSQYKAAKRKIFR